MQFEWDEDKNNENMRKHKLDFSNAWQVFENPVTAKLDERETYGEARWISIGMMSKKDCCCSCFHRKRAGNDSHHFHEKGNKK